MLTIGRADCPPFDLRPLYRIAAEVINAHVNDGGRCRRCRSTWPCERAVLAEHNLAL